MFSYIQILFREIACYSIHHRFKAFLCVQRNRQDNFNNRDQTRSHSNLILHPHDTGLPALFKDGSINGLESIRFIAIDYVAAFYAANNSHFNGENFFISQHDESDPLYLGKLSWLAEEAYKLPLKLIVINDDMKSKFKDREPLIFHVGIADRFRDSNRSIRKKFSVLMPLRTGEMKGAKYGIECAEKIHKSYLDIEIMAFGNYPKDSVPEFIEYHYLPNDNDILSLYRRSSVFVLPSLLEGMSLPPLEAMASGCAVVSSDCIGVRVYLINEHNGLLVPRADSEALFNAVRRLYENPDLMNKIIENGLTTANIYSYDNMVNGFISCVENNKT